MVSVGFSFSEVLDMSLYQLEVFGKAGSAIEHLRRTAQTTDLVNAIQIALGGEPESLRKYCATLTES